MFSCLVMAQRPSGGHPPPSPKAAPPPVHPDPSTFDQQLRQVHNSAPSNPPVFQRDTCFFPPLSALQFSTIGVTSLQIGSKAKKEYVSGCQALRDGEYDKAEQSLRKAVKEEPKYAAAWVTLGQLFAGRQKIDDAREACSQARSADPMYVPSYLCLAEIAARTQNWEETLRISDQALQIDSASDPLAYDYKAAAGLKLQRLDDAEKSALKAIEIDRNHADPRVHFVLAQIYEAKGERAKEQAELREYLKSEPSDAATVRQFLSALDSEQK
jgi:tetratricopeptide (TPR) repeat protein